MSAAGVLRTFLLILSLLVAALGLAGPVLAQSRSSHGLVITVDGIINPVKERFISRTLRQAEEDRAALVIMHLDTPGGLLSSTRKIVEELLAAQVPVAVYVSPAGARAGSAGTFITAAAHFAVMAPGTNIGAATPVASSGQKIEEPLASKVTNDAAALMRSIAQTRGRNQEKLEETVRKAASFTATEAVELKVVDFIARDLDDLLAQLHGRVVETPAGPRTLDTRNLELRSKSKGPVESFLEFISDPNISAILLTVGGLGIVIELFNPGLIVPGVVGGIALLLAFLALGNLPFNWAGVAFILLAVVLAVLETQVAGFGILGVGAIISFIVGGLLLFAQFGDASPTLPRVAVSRWLLIGMAAALGLAVLSLARLVYQSRKSARQVTGPSLVGAVGMVAAALAPRGVVQVGDETWTAVSEDDSVIPVGEKVRVTRVDGLILTVSRRRDGEP